MVVRNANKTLVEHLEEAVRLQIEWLNPAVINYHEYDLEVDYKQLKVSVFLQKHQRADQHDYSESVNEWFV